jgi:triacylglycerol esterase/lipase EstA (alpha/beta hydrolase family)
MKTKVISTILLALSLGGFSAMAIAQHESHSTKKAPSQPATQGKQEMPHDHMMMAKEPHHVLAMAYHQNLATFAKALHEQTAQASSVNVEFVRAAVAEMRRSFDQMEEHHGEHLQTMSAEMRSQMAAMMKDMEMHRSMLKDAVSALEADVRAEQPDSKQVATDSANVLKHLDEMSKMHDDKQGKTMKKMKKMKM